MKENKERENLRKQLDALMKQENELREKIDELDYNSKLNKLKKFVGRYFKQVQSESEFEDCIRCVFVYGIREYDSPNLMSLSFTYWKDNDSAHFDIEYDGHFSYKPIDNDFPTKWTEIKRDEFYQHYREVQNRISNALLMKHNDKITPILEWHKLDECSTRLRNALIVYSKSKFCEVDSVGDIEEYTLMRISGCGRKTVKEFQKLRGY